MTVKVSYVIGVYNGEEQIAETIQSVLSQTYLDLECIVVDDGSIDGTKTVIKNIMSKDERLKYFYKQNEGLTKALIFGCEKATGEFIARLDCGDMAKDIRTEVQLEVFEKNPTLILCASNAEKINEKNEVQYLEYSYKPRDEIKETLLFKNPFIHSSVMMKRSAYFEAGSYDKRFTVAQDYNLWTRMALLGEYEILNQSLVLSRLDTQGLSFTKIEQQVLSATYSSTNYYLNNQFDFDVIVKSKLLELSRKNLSELSNEESLLLLFNFFHSVKMTPNQMILGRFKVYILLKKYKVFLKSMRVLNAEEIIKILTFFILGKNIYAALFDWYFKKKYSI